MSQTVLCSSSREFNLILNHCMHMQNTW